MAAVRHPRCFVFPTHVGVFPDKWERLLKERPDLAPAVEKVIPDLCRVADGTADWLELANTYQSERLQVLGNGVVPLTGAIALATLFKRLTGESNVK